MLHRLIKSISLLDASQLRKRFGKRLCLGDPRSLLGGIGVSPVKQIGESWTLHPLEDTLPCLVDDPSTIQTSLAPFSWGDVVAVAEGLEDAWPSQDPTIVTTVLGA